MIIERVLEDVAQARPGFNLVAFKEAALPNYLLTTRLLTLESKSLGPIEEACLQAVSAGLSNPEDICSFLGLPQVIINSVLTDLNIAEVINYSRPTQAEDALVSLTQKGRATLETLKEVVPQESIVKFVFDPYKRKISFIPTSSMYRPKEVKEKGWYEVPLCGARRPEVGDIPLENIDKVLQQSRRDGVTRELLAIRRIERREMYFLPCIMLFYRSISDQTIQVAFYFDDGLSLEHEEAFRRLGGPEIAGANHALDNPDIPSLDDLASDIVEKEKTIEPSTEACSDEQQESNLKIAVNEIVEQQQRAMTQRAIRAHEHPVLLRKALNNTKNRLLIISPWINHFVIDKIFLISLEALLRNEVEITIGYGISDENGTIIPNKATERPAVTPQAHKDLTDIQKKFKNFKLIHIGNTHRKLLISDDTFAVVTSFNWLSFRGDPKKQPRDELGYLITEPSQVDHIYNDGIDLTKNKYSYPDRSK